MSGITAGQGSVSVWARPSGFTTNPNYLFGHATSDWGNRIQLFCNSSGGLCLGLGDMHFRASNIMTLPSNAWSHVALAWNGANYTVYVNGAAKASGTYTGLATIASAADFGNDGTAGHNEAFNGIIDEARTYNYALSASEVGQIYAAGSGSGSTTNHAPVLAAIGNKTVTAGSLLSFAVSAADSDNDAVTYSASVLPAGATFNSGTFSWIPSQAGTYSVTFTASDGKASDTETITITVSAGTQTGTGPVFTQL
jgi:PKD repeat protein